MRPEERVLWWCRPSPIGVVPILASTALAVAVLLVQLRFGVDTPGIVRGTPALLLAALGVLAELARRLMRLRFTSYVITEERIYAITSFFVTNARSIPLSRATHVALRQGLFGRLFGYWTARVSGYGTGRTALDIPAIADGEGLLREVSAGIRRGANVGWLLRGD